MLGRLFLLLLVTLASAWVRPALVRAAPVVTSRGAAGAEGTGCVLWKGTVGGLPVAVLLERESVGRDGLTGEYGIPHGGAVTALRAQRRGESWLVEERSGATWALEERGVDRVGTWRSADGRKTFPILLDCLVHENGRAADASSALLIGGGSPARQLMRLLRRGLTVETEVAVGNARYRNAVDVILGRVYLQLTALDPQRRPRPALLRELNERVRQHMAKVAQEQKVGREQFPECEVESTVEIKFASARFLTLSTLDEWSCGSIHPEQNGSLETFDVSGERAVEVALTETYRPGRDERTKRAFWRVVAAARASAASGGHSLPPLDATCAEDAALGAHYELGLVQGGVLVNVDFGSYAAAPCDFSVVIPTQVMQRFVAPASPVVPVALRRRALRQASQP